MPVGVTTAPRALRRHRLDHVAAHARFGARPDPRACSRCADLGVPVLSSLAAPTAPWLLE